VGATNPFEVLGLSARPDLSDDDIRSAWKRIAARTHPDREDGGDPARYAAAADAYSRLRTGWEREDVFLGGSDPPQTPPANGGLPAPRPLARVLVRVACAASAGGCAYASLGWAPATPAIITGAVTWLILTGRRDLAAGAS